MEINLTKRPFITVLGAFFSSAGLYHFINPDFYLGLIPDYLPQPLALNYGVGILELVLGILVLIPSYRKIGGYGIVLLLLLLIPSHIFFIQTGSCVPNGLCVPKWISWGRLILIHPLLVYWGYTVSKN
jgi:uncharacterized membrane protein